MADLIYFLRYLYQLIGYRIAIWLTLIVGAAIFEGFSVALFLPLLEGVTGDSSVTRYTTSVFGAFGLQPSFSLLLLAIVILFVVRTVLLILQEVYVWRIVTGILVRLKTGLVRKLFQADYKYFVGKEIGYMTNAATIEYNRVVFSFETCMRLLVGTGFAILYFALPLAINPLVTVIVVILGIPAYLAFRKANRLTYEYSLIATENNARLQSYLIQAFHNFKYLKATHSTGGLISKVYRESEQQGQILYKQNVLSSFVQNGTEPFVVFLIAGLVFYQVEILGGAMLEIVFLLFLVRRAINHSLISYQGYRKFLQAAGSISVFKGLESELEDNQEDMNPEGSAPDFGQPICFSNLWFGYDNSAAVLKNLNLTIAPRTTVAFVGASGAGKSTLVTLLTGILKPTQGEIFFGEQLYSRLNQEQLRRGIGYVTQESVIFNDSIRNNITLWEEISSEGQVEKAAKNAHIDQFIEQLPDGYDSSLGDNGLNISGGQRQRINIARELLKEVKLLIMDEATSSLDSDSEREIQQNIDEFRGTKTIVLIAHRLSTIRNSDTIFVLKDGEVVEAGSYQQLHSLNGEFRRMVDQQDAQLGETEIQPASGERR